MPAAFGSATYLAPSLPVIVLPQHLLAGYGGLGRLKYFLVVCIMHLDPLLRLCTLFQYLRSLAWDWVLAFALALALNRFRVAMFIQCDCIIFSFSYSFSCCMDCPKPCQFAFGLACILQCMHRCRGWRCIAGCAWSMHKMNPNAPLACGRLWQQTWDCSRTCIQLIRTGDCRASTTTRTIRAVVSS